MNPLNQWTCTVGEVSRSIPRTIENRCLSRKAIIQITV